MLARITSTIVRNQRTSVRLFNTSILCLNDSDGTRSKAKDKASDDLKSRKEQRWLDTVATDSEAAIKGEKQHAAKQGDFKKDLSDLQRDTIDAIKDKETKGHLSKYDVGRRDTREERIGSGSSNKKK